MQKKTQLENSVLNGYTAPDPPEIHDTAPANFSLSPGISLLGRLGNTGPLWRVPVPRSLFIMVHVSLARRSLLHSRRVTGPQGSHLPLIHSDVGTGRSHSGPVQQRTVLV